MKQGLKIAFGILLAVIVMAFTPIYDIYIKDRIDSVDVVVVKAGNEIEATEPITADKLQVESRRKQDLVEGTILAGDIKQVIGYDAGQLLVGNAIISKDMVDYDKLVPNEKEGEAIRPIVSDMIFAMPGSVRRKDTIDIYLVSNSLIGQYAKEESAASSSSSDKQKEAVANGATLKKPLLTDVKVVYAKDSSNKEVVTDTETKPKEENERLNATGNISDLEVILNQEDFDKLMSAVIEQKNKLYITYN